MADYAALFQTITAMLIFSLVLVNANRMILRNDIMQVEGELEQETIALGQDILEEARTKEFDENSMAHRARLFQPARRGDLRDQRHLRGIVDTDHL